MALSNGQLWSDINSYIAQFSCDTLDTKEKRRLARNCLSLFPDRAESFALMACLAEAEKKLNQAIKYYWEAWFRDSLNVCYLEKIIDIASRLNKKFIVNNTIEGLRYMFLKPPSPYIISRIISNGFNHLHGSVGIHCRHVVGWTIISSRENLIVETDGVEIGNREIEKIWEDKTEKLCVLRFSLELKNIDPNGAIVRILGRYGMDIYGSPLFIENPMSCSLGKAIPKDRGVSVIIPVHKKLGPFKDCMESVISTLNLNDVDFTVRIMCDGNSEKKLSNYLDTLKKRKNVKITFNISPLGFMGTVNKAIRQTFPDDVIILNSDTLVYGNWVDRLKEVAYSLDRIGTVTPTGSWSEITSIPYPPVKRKISLEEVRQIDTVCQKYLRNSFVPIPSGVGFCMYIKREVVEEVGGLDSTLLMHGYGEEVDFCLRAGERGYLNVATPSVFVGHSGETTFGFVRKRFLVAQNALAINQRWPKFQEEYINAVRTDPLKEFREIILKQSGHV